MLVQPISFLTVRCKYTKSLSPLLFKIGNATVKATYIPSSKHNRDIGVIIQHIEIMNNIF
jgi:hypothetical protein